MSETADARKLAREMSRCLDRVDDLSLAFSALACLTAAMIHVHGKDYDPVMTRFHERAREFYDAKSDTSGVH